MHQQLAVPIAAAWILSLAQAASATTRRVPTDFPTIQGAIGASAAGDTVLVLPGTYVENIVIERDIVVRSAQGPAVTVIDGSQPAHPDSASTVRMNAGAVMGCDIRNGAGTYTGVIYGWVGGGVFGTGPGVIRITDCWLHDNTLPAAARGYGGGVFLAVEVDRATVSDNRIHNNLILSQETGSGAGLAGGGETSLIERNEIYDNHVETGRAAGLNTRAEVRDNVIACNSIDVPIVPYPVSAVIVGGNQVEGNTVVANWSASGSPPAVFVNAPDTPPTLLGRNNIVYNLGPGVECRLNHQLGQLSFECNNIGFNSGPPVVGDCGQVIGQNGNISVEPAFGRGNCPYTPGDFCLAQDSPLLPANSPPWCGLIGAVGECAPDAVGEAEAAAAPFGMLGARPNPFVERTAIAFHLPEQAEVEVVIYGVPGRRVRTLQAGMLGAGDHELAWDGRGDDGRRVASGGYVARIRAGSREVTRTLLLVR